MHKTTRLLLSATLLAGLPITANALNVEQVWSGLTVPWSIEFDTETSLYVSERNGQVWHLDLKNQSKRTLGMPQNVYMGGQGGLLDLALSKSDAPQLYLTFSQQTDNGATTALARIDPAQSNSNWTTLFTTTTEGGGGRHFGSRMLIDGEHLYMTIGDRGERESAQNLNSHNGSLLRLNLDGTSANNVLAKQGALPEIYSYGHRNAQGITQDDQGRIWSIEHGPRGGDEINLISEQTNYGWPITSHGKEYWGPLKVGEAETKAGIHTPDLVYVPSIAPGSLLFYSGSRYPSLNGKLLAGSLKLTHINVVSIDNGQLVESERLFESLKERIRDLALSPDGYLYFSTDNGNIYRIVE